MRLCNNVVTSRFGRFDCNQNRSYFECSKLKFECNFNTMGMVRILEVFAWVEGRVPTTISLRSPTRPAAGRRRHRLTHTTPLPVYAERLDRQGCQTLN